MSDPPIVMLDAPPPVSAELRAQILSDPNIAKIAAELGMPLDQFVNRIGYFMNNPGAEPGFIVVSDENLKTHLGVTAPTQEELEANVRASVEAIKAGQSPSGFEQKKKAPVAMPKDGGDLGHPNKAPAQVGDPELADALKKLLRGRKT